VEVSLHHVPFRSSARDHLISSYKQACLLTIHLLGRNSKLDDWAQQHAWWRSQGVHFDRYCQYPFVQALMAVMLQQMRSSSHNKETLQVCASHSC
jgi:hypothetical protein